MRARGLSYAHQHVVEFQVADVARSTALLLVVGMPGRDSGRGFLGCGFEGRFPEERASPELARDSTLDMIRGLSFNYVVVQAPATPTLTEFQAFERSWVTAIPLITAVIQLPSCLGEMRGGLSNRVRLRSLGFARYSIALVDSTILKRLPVPPFMVIVTADSVDPAGRDFLRAHHDQPILHLPSKPRPGELGLHDASTDGFEAWVQRVANHAVRVQPELEPYVRALLATPK